MEKWYAIYSNILHLHFSDGFLELPESAKQTYSPKSVIVRLAKVTGYTFKRLCGNIFKSVEEPQNLYGKIWLYIVSQNNYDSLKFISSACPDVAFVAGQAKEMGKYKEQVQRISLRRKILYYYKFIPLFIKFLGARKTSTIRFFDILYDAIGFYEIYYSKLAKYKPKAIIFANDHNPDARAMLLAAKQAGIRTIYIQHASVSTLFPPLSFDLNLLEGQDSLDKYKLCGLISGKVCLIGMPKADKYLPSRNKKEIIETIGIGCSLIDDLLEIKRLLQTIRLALPQLEIVLRPHPRDKRDFAKLITQNSNTRISDSKAETTFDYLQHIDAQISATSGIHLEAVLLNVWSIYFDLSKQDQVEDYYGFIRNGLIDKADTIDILISLLAQNIYDRPQVLHRAKYYNSVIGTANDGFSSDLALSTLTEYLSS